MRLDHLLSKDTWLDLDECSVYCILPILSSQNDPPQGGFFVVVKLKDVRLIICYTDLFRSRLKLEITMYSRDQNDYSVQLPRWYGTTFRTTPFQPAGRRRSFAEGFADGFTGRLFWEAVGKAVRRMF